MSTQGKYLYMVMMDVDSANEDEFNKLYSEEHVPFLLDVPSVISAARFKTSSNGFPKYMAVYELESPGVTESEAWRKAAGSGEFPGIAGAHASNRQRAKYERINPEG